jgi:transcriptional regulator with XRE-family HTH domain
MRPAKKIKSDFSRNLTKLRQQRGLTQQQLAEQTGDTLAMVAYLESKAANPRASTLIKYADFFDVLVDDLLRA